jgi:hypothetical protein
VPVNRRDAALRSRAGLDVNALGLTQSSASLRLSGKVPFTLDDLGIIATWLEISLAELLGSQTVTTKNPRQHTADGDSDSKLLRLDLNQQPFDYWSGMVRSYALAYALVSAAAASVPSSSADHRTGS